MSLNTTDNDDLPSCNICLLNYDSSTRRPMVLNCDHTYCASCTTQILQNWQPLCPHCRTPFKSTDVKVNYELSDSMDQIIAILVKLDANRPETKDNPKSDDAQGSPEDSDFIYANLKKKFEQTGKGITATAISESTSSTSQSSIPQRRFSGMPTSTSSNIRNRLSNPVELLQLPTEPPNEDNLEDANLDSNFLYANLRKKFEQTGKDKKAQVSEGNDLSTSQGSIPRRRFSAMPMSSPSNSTNRFSCPVQTLQPAPNLSYEANLTDTDSDFNPANLRRKFEQLGKVITAKPIQGNVQSAQNLNLETHMPSPATTDTASVQSSPLIAEPTPIVEQTQDVAESPTLYPKPSVVNNPDCTSSNTPSSPLDQTSQSILEQLPQLLPALSNEENTAVDNPDSNFVYADLRKSFEQFGKVITAKTTVDDVKCLTMTTAVPSPDGTDTALLAESLPSVNQPTPIQDQEQTPQKVEPHKLFPGGVQFLQQHRSQLRRTETFAEGPKGNQSVPVSNHSLQRSTSSCNQAQISPINQNMLSSLLQNQQVAPAHKSTANLRVDNLDPNFTDVDLRKVFEQFGRLEHATITKENDQSTGHISFAVEAHAELAMAVLDKTKIGSNYIYVSKQN